MPVELLLQIITSNDCNPQAFQKIIALRTRTRFFRRSTLRWSSRPPRRISICAANCWKGAKTSLWRNQSRGRYIATLDADLQNDPKDLPTMLEALKNAECVCGTRSATRGKGDNWIRIAFFPR